MFVFAIRMLRDRWKSLVIYSITALGFLEMYIALFPVVHQRANQFDLVIKTFPPEIFKAMNIDPNSLSFASIESYLSTEYMSFLWPILAIIFAISLASYISINEIDRGTIETLASLPARRSKIFLQRYFTGLILLAGFCIISLFGAIPLAILHNTEFIFNNFLTAVIGSFLFIWAVYSLTTLFSVVFSEKGKSTMATGGVLILMYVINIISALQKDFMDLKYFSFFHYYKGSDLLAMNIYTEYAVLALGGFAVVTTIGALIWFNRRDLSV